GVGGGGRREGEGEEEEELTLKLWDFGGRDDFHAVHGMFFSRRTLYAVVFDLRHGEREEVNQSVQFWIDLVQTRVPGARIQLIGTHADMMHPSEVKRQCDRVSRQVMENEASIVSAVLLQSGGDRKAAREIGHARIRPKIEPRVIPISCSTLDGFKELSDRVLSIAGDPEAFPAPLLPPLWGRVDSLVRSLRDHGRNLVRVSELRKLAAAPADQDLYQGSSSKRTGSESQDRSTEIRTGTGTGTGTGRGGEAGGGGGGGGTNVVSNIVAGAWV
ncbi:unnamed protein product, partial [Choristocarpus tenellus]